MVLKVQRTRKGRGGWGEGGMEVGDEGDYIPIATPLSAPEPATPALHGQRREPF